MEYGLWKLGKNDFKDAMSVRKTVFVDELGMQESEVFDFMDDYAAHLVWLDDAHAPIGTVRMYPFQNHTIRLDNLCVVSKARGRRTGELMLRMLLDRTTRMGKREVVAFVPEAYEGYFIKQGFKSGEHYADDEGRALIKMSIINDNLPVHTCHCHGENC